MLFTILSSEGQTASALLVKDIFLLLAACVIFIQAKSWVRWRSLKKWGRQNGCGDCPTVPNKLPGGIERMIGLVFKGIKNIDVLEDIIRAQYDRIGATTYRTHDLFGSAIMTCQPENIQAIHATQFHDFDITVERKNTFFDLMGDGIFTAAAKEWAHYRPMIKPQFTRVQIQDLASAASHLDVLFKALPSQNQQGWIEEVDLLRFLYRFTMDVSTEFLFGESVHSQGKLLHAEESNNPTEVQADMDFAEAMRYAQEDIAMRLQFSFLSYLAPFQNKKFRQACNVVKTFADRVVARAFDPDYKPEVGKYIFLNELKKETQDPVELRDQVLHLLIAGTDSTSSLIGWTLLLLARHPEEFGKLRSAILDQFGTESSPGEELSFASLKACKPLQHVLYEALRFYPLVPLNARVALKDTTLPVGGGPDHEQPIAVMKGEGIVFVPYVMQRRHDLWGEDADEFHPSRWEARKLGWDFLAFGGGPRVCVGQQYALNEAGFVIVKFLQRFDKIEALDMVGKLEKRLSIVMSPGNGVTVKMHRAEE